MIRCVSWASLFAVGFWSVATANAADPLAQDRNPSIVFAVFEDEYHAAESLSRFAQQLTDRFGYRCRVLPGDKETGIPGLEELATADALVLYVRRHPLPKQQMAMIRRYLDAGKPLVALRTSSHAFSLWTPAPPGIDTWPEFDRDVLGGNYQDHYKAGGRTEISVAQNAAEHPILAGIQFRDWSSTASLYKNAPLGAGPTVLLTGKYEAHVEPIAWTHSHRGGRVFYTSLGDAQDFQTPRFCALLVNAIHWSMNKPVPKGR